MRVAVIDVLPLLLLVVHTGVHVPSVGRGCVMNNEGPRVSADAAAAAAALDRASAVMKGPCPTLACEASE